MPAPLGGISDHGKEMAPLGAPSASSAFFCRLPRRRSRDLSAVAWRIFGAHHLHDISGMFRAFSPLACFESHPLALQARLVWYAPLALRRTQAVHRWRFRSGVWPGRWPVRRHVSGLQPA